MQHIFRNLVRAISLPISVKLLYSGLPARYFALDSKSHVFTQIKSRTYNNKFNEARTAEILDLLRHHKLEYKERDENFTIKYCPFCLKPHKEKTDNLYKLNVHKTSGCYFCFRCSAKGSWYDFKRLINAGNDSQVSSDDQVGIASLSEMSGITNSTPSGITSDPLKLRLGAEKHQALLLQKYKNSIEYLTGKDYTKGQRGLKLETLIHYKVGIGLEKFRNEKNEYCSFESVYFPMYSPKPTDSPKITQAESSEVQKSREIIETDRHQLQRWKIRAIGKENKTKMRVDPAGKIWYF